jgi:hypothetical protein
VAVLVADHATVTLLMGDLNVGMAHAFRNGWRTSRAFAVAAISTTVVLHALALLAAANYPSAAATGITAATLTPLAAGLWAALALLPALGGVDTDDPMAVAAAGGGRSFMFGARIGASLTDAGPGLFVPSLAIIGAAAAGWPGWLAGLALAWNGLACGQLAGASSALLMKRIGPTWALLVIASAVLLAATLLVYGGIGPGAWWLAATDHPAYAALLVASGAAALGGAWVLNRPAERSLRPTSSIHLPRDVLAALTVVMATGIGRSIAARSTIVTAALAPLLIRSTGQEATGAIAFFVMAAAAPVLGANGFAYDGGASVWLLGKVGRWTLLSARLISTSSWVLLLAAVACLSGALVGAPVHLDVLLAMPVVAVAAGAAGLFPSVHRPAATDFDSFRAQSAPVSSAIGTLARASLLTVAALYLPIWGAAIAVGLYAGIALLHSHRELRDPVALATLT